MCFEQGEKGLGILHLNVHGLCSKVSELKDMVVTHAIMLCVTLLNEAHESLCRLPGYTLVSNNRTDGRGEGVAIYIMDSLTFSRRPDLEVYVSKAFESIVIEINTTSGKILLSEMYRTGCRTQVSVYQSSVIAPL